MLDIALAFIMLPAIAVPYLTYIVLRRFKYKDEKLETWG